MNLSAKDNPSANSTGAPYVAGNFAPLMNEVTAFDLEVMGRIPEALNVKGSDKPATHRNVGAVA